LPGKSIYSRYQPGVTDELEQAGQKFWFVCSSGKLLLKVDVSGVRVPFLTDLTEVGISPIRTQYLGTLEGSPCYSAEADAAAVAPAGMAFLELRPLYSALDEDLFLLAGKALQIVAWDQTHQFCGRCGARTETLRGERAKKCPACGFTSYPRLAPAVIVGVVKEDRLLLARYARLKVKFHAILAGFVEPGETLEECVKREMAEEVGIRVKNIKYFGSQPWPFPNSLMIGFTADYESGEISVDGTEVSEADWYGVRNLPELPSGMSIARQIIDWFIETYS
jgi:NAD+ diphosphatase